MIVIVTVYQKRVEIMETAGYTMVQSDAQCRIDGELYQYIFKRDSFNTGKNWRERANSEAYYHAKNQGERVEWLPVKRPGKTTPKSKKNPNQKPLF